MNEATWNNMNVSERKSYLDKKNKISELVVSSGDYIFQKFFDDDSDEMLDEKLEVLEKLNEGVSPGDILNYYKVLELYPNNEAWD